MDYTQFNFSSVISEHDGEPLLQRRPISFALQEHFEQLQMIRNLAMLDWDPDGPEEKPRLYIDKEIVRHDKIADFDQPAHEGRAYSAQDVL